MLMYLFSIAQLYALGMPQNKFNKSKLAKNFILESIISQIHMKYLLTWLSEQIIKKFRDSKRDLVMLPLKAVKWYYVMMLREKGTAILWYPHFRLFKYSYTLYRKSLLGPRAKSLIINCLAICTLKKKKKKVFVLFLCAQWESSRRGQTGPPHTITCTIHLYTTDHTILLDRLESVVGVIGIARS